MATATTAPGTALLDTALRSPKARILSNRAGGSLADTKRTTIGDFTGQMVDSVLDRVRSLKYRAQDKAGELMSGPTVKAMLLLGAFGVSMAMCGNVFSEMSNPLSHGLVRNQDETGITVEQFMPDGSSHLSHYVVLDSEGNNPNHGRQWRAPM